MVRNTIGIPQVNFRDSYSQVKQASFPNLRRLFIEARSDDEEREVSRRAFYNAVLFFGSVAVFGLVAQRLNANR
ncbi:Uu.00g141950.m01.CDS01 [Anthostomella pinea]|uniref:Uu.00g141950.m01.CDS01 n=1 Tax=Anthostomella pinea TaxID=933095 RepID=A0AAI8YLJ9_9PEZI|nr:Uu.00g141950.m01.CDS01 [Anthostomella pinea]